jgi:hypothetical protein
MPAVNRSRDRVPGVPGWAHHVTELADAHDEELVHVPDAHRMYRLTPWLVRALVPAQRVGSYLLYSPAEPSYVGRSDVCLRRRLLRHAYDRRAEYFAFDTHWSQVHAYTMECAVFHALRPQLSNLIHPDAPNHLEIHCPFCRDQWALPRLSRPLGHPTERFVPNPRSNP